MTPDVIVHLLSAIVDRVRRVDHWVVPKGGSPSHRTQRLAAPVLMNHALRLIRVGACPMERGSSTTRLALLDLDSHKGEVSWPDMLALGRRLIEAGALVGLNFIPFSSSGGKGLHLYLIWDGPQDARSVRVLLSDVLASVGLSNGTRGVREREAEIFPKQDSIPADGWGNMFVLPMSGESKPIDPATMAFVDLTEVDWPTSEPVPVVPAPTYAVVVSGPQEYGKVREALFAIDPNTLDYSGWLRLLFAVHASTDASEEGRALIHEWSSQFNRYDPAETDKQWSAAKIKPGGIGWGTLRRAAWEAAGWVDPDDAPTADGFEVIADAPPVGPAATVDNSPTITATVAAMRDPAVAGCLLAHDNFTGGTMVQVAGQAAWRPITDNDTTRVRMALEHWGFKKPSIEDARAAVNLIAEERQMDQAQDWLNGLPAWDGTPRVKKFMHRYLGARDCAYSDAVGLYLWTAMAGRVLEPGCQADMIPVFVGPQGVGKTSSVRALVPDPDEQVCSVNLANTRDADQSRLLRGKLIGEIGELRGLGTRDAESIKDWVTKRTEEWTPKFKEHNVRYPRRCVFIGTTNERDFLSDPTGNRRWLPIETPRADVPAIVRDRDQLWAEAAELFRAQGVLWREAERLSVNEHRLYMSPDEWTEAIREHLTETGRKMSIREIAAEVLRIELKSLDRRTSKRIEACLKAIPGIVYWKGRDSSKTVTGLWCLRQTTVDDLL